MNDPTPRTILHVDLDAFFASVEVREDPSLRGKPVVIGADPQGGRGRGVVSTASYEAREYGIHSAQPVSQAWRRCPHAVFLPPRGALYAKASRRFFAILHRFTDLVEPLSIDEAFLDVTDSRRLFGDGRAIAQRIQQEVKEEEHLTASVGVAPVKFAAKIASDLRKPEGLVVVPAERLQEFLDRMPVKRLFGAGPKAQEQLASLGIESLGDLGRFPRDQLVAVFGGTMGRHFHDLAQGIDPRAVQPDRERKSLGKEQTYLTDQADRHEVRRTLLWLVEEVSAGLRRRGLKGRTVMVKLRTSDFTTRTRRRTLTEPVDTTDAIWPVAQELLESIDETDLPIRLVGVALAEFGAVTPSLFDVPGQDASQRMSRVMDQVTEQFGAGSLVRGSLIGRQGERDEDNVYRVPEGESDPPDPGSAGPVQDRRRLDAEDLFDQDAGDQ